ncbi:hypothetical protein [Actinomycetospora sp.]|uniref:hypothetical protein n=1 Tax=Actinomycetospora sp. TaxID=1872135 RepID=UPI002F409DF2
MPPVRADVRPAVPAPTPVGTLAPVALMLPGSPEPAGSGAQTAALRIGPPARRVARARAVLDV